MPSFPKLYVEGPEGETEVRPGFGNRGTPLLLPHTQGSVELYTKITTPEGAIRPLTLCDVRIPSECKGEVNVILLRNPNQPMQFSGHVINEAPDAFPAGTVLFENYFPNKIAIKLGQETFPLHFGEKRMSKINLKSQTQTRLPFLAAVENENGWEFRKSGQLALWPNSRMLIISTPYLQEDKQSVFRVHYIQDVPKAITRE